MITLDFEKAYEPITIKRDYEEMTFEAPQADGNAQLLLVQIKPHPDPYLPAVYNLGFGPVDGKGAFLDNVRLNHADSSRVLSTVLFHGFSFLYGDYNLTLGIDGSDDARTAMYHLMIKKNRTYLEQYFEIIGVDWYVRVFRNWELELDKEGDILAKPKPEAFDYHRNRDNLYRYYMFRLKRPRHRVF